MRKFEFKVVSAPGKTQRFADLGPGEDPYNRTVASAMNELGSDGWEFVGAEMLPEPKRMFGGRRPMRNVLVFRREIVPLEQVETEKAKKADVAGLDSDAIRPRRIRKVAGPSFVRHAELRNGNADSGVPV